MGRWFFNWTCNDEDVCSEPNPQPESSGSALSPSTTWLLPEVVPSYGRLNEYYCFNICLSLHDTFVRINCLELDGRLAWWRAALTIFTSYVNWNYYKLHPRCFFWPLWRLQLGGCAGRGHSEAWGGASFVWLCPVPENLICLRSICQTPDTAAQCPPGPPKSQSKPKWVTCQPHTASSSSSKILSWAQFQETMMTLVISLPCKLMLMIKKHCRS